jgi:hypothetical protein
MTGGARAARLALAGMLLTALAAGCGGDEGDEATGRADIRFSGSVSGTLSAGMDVDCSPPSEQGGRFIVSFDSDEGTKVGGRTFVALDVATPPYQGPRTYDLKDALASDPQLGENFFLLFREFEEQPLSWGVDEEASGTLTIDSGERSGRLSMRGWASSERLRVNMEGSFRCGELQPGQGPERGMG